MGISTPRRWVAGALALTAILGAGACGGPDDAERAAAGPARAAAEPGDTTTTVAAGPADPGASPVAGLDAAELRAAVGAPVPPGLARAAGPTADRVTLADGTTVWRVRIPGAVPARAARVTIAVGGRDVGPGLPPADLSALVAVTPDGTGLVDGAAVTYRWEGADPVAAGALEVLS